MAETTSSSQVPDAEPKEISRSSPGPSRCEIDNTSLNGLQNLAEASLDQLQESVPGANVSTESIPGPLPKEGVGLCVIKESLLNLIAKCEAQEEEELTLLVNRRQFQNDVHKAALMSHTIGAYISSLEKPVVSRIGLHLISDTTLWISKIFRFFDSSAFFCRDPREGLIRVVRMLLHTRYPRYATTGYEALFTRPPVIYYCEETVGQQLAFLCSQLGLPLSCITTVPGDEQSKMDLASLERCIREDRSASRTPLLAVCAVGGGVLGHTDPLAQVRDLCRTHNVHLHLQGHGLAALALDEDPPSNDLCDSMGLNLGDWIGLPSLTHITLYRGSYKEMSGSQTHLDFLPVWLALQTLGTDQLTQILRHSFQMSDVLLEKLESISDLRILSQKRSVAKEGSQEVLLESSSSAVVFQFGTENQEKNPTYYDNLNSWLVQVLYREVPSVKTEIVELPAFGVALRLCFMESAHALETKLDDVELYIQKLQEKVEILRSTVSLRRRLAEEHAKYPKLQVVEMEEWAGMGGVRYIPDMWLDRLNELTDTGKADINHLNLELVEKLKVSDSAFSLGEADDGMFCVRFGMVDSHLDLDELMNLVTTAGQEMEESTKFLETMSEVVKQGILDANKELVKENTEKMMQEGVLRQVPVLGSLVSWWYPSSPSEVGIKGRSFNLASGTIESTENIYKYHMQVKEEPH